MAKDVNLTSKQWLDIVFDGKNKEFGAYQLRAESPKRHTKSVIIVLAILALVVIGLILSISGILNFSGEDANAGVDQQDMSLYNGEDEMEEEEQIQKIEEPEQKPEELPKEEVINSIQNTELVIKKDEEVTQEVKSQDELLNDNRQMGAVDQDKGIDDAMAESLKKDVEPVVEEKKPEPEPVKKVDDQVYTVATVEQMPSFPGGEGAMYSYLSSHIQYPAVAAEEGIEGRVVVQFVVSKTGAIENVKIAKGKHPALDKEAIRVVKSMPAWVPGRMNGQPVKVSYNLPVTFKMAK